MPTTQLGGPIGPFFDNVQQRGVPVSAFGQVDYSTASPPPDPARLENDVRNGIMTAMRNIIGQKMATGQLQFRNLGEGNLGTTIDEIIQATGLPQMGVQIGNLSLRFSIDDGPPQMEVRANINVGGFHIKAGSKDGVNVGDLGGQLVAKAKSAIIWYVATAVLVAVIGAVAWWYIKHTIHKAIDQSIAVSKGTDVKWDGTTPLMCGGSQEMTFEGVTAKLPGTAVTAGGSCHLTLKNCDITGATAIDAMGSAIVTIEGGSITGSTAALHALGSPEVHMTGTKVNGKIDKLGSPKITGP
jgi:hypothetical protein